MWLNSSWEANSSSAIEEIPRVLWNPQGSLLCSQEPVPGLYPESDESSWRLPSNVLNISLMLPSHQRWGPTNRPRPSVFPTQERGAFPFSPMNATVAAQFIPLDLIIWHSARSTSHQASHYAVQVIKLLITQYKSSSFSLCSTSHQASH
jgi:hypothetical protein